MILFAVVWGVLVWLIFTKLARIKPTRLILAIVLFGATVFAVASMFVGLIASIALFPEAGSSARSFSAGSFFWFSLIAGYWACIRAYVRRDMVRVNSDEEIVDHYEVQRLAERRELAKGRMK